MGKPQVRLASESHSTKGGEGKGNERVVGRLGHVDVVVGVNRLLGSKLSSQDLDGLVGDDLVDVHVGLGSRSSLEDNEREVVDKLATDDLWLSKIGGSIRG